MIKIRRLTAFLIFVLAVWVTKLVYKIIISELEDYYNDGSIQAILIEMLVTILVFVPLYGIVLKMSESGSRAYLRVSKSAVGNTRLGLFIGFFLAFLIIFYLWALVFHHVDVLKIFLN